jgi:O-antigen/teichoic acid export membrane protein
MGVASGKWFLSENLQIIAFWRVFYGMILNILLNIFLIPKYGIEGAAFATLASQSVAAYFSDFFNKKTRPMFFTKTKALLLIKGFG